MNNIKVQMKQEKDKKLLLLVFTFKWLFTSITYRTSKVNITMNLPFICKILERMNSSAIRTSVIFTPEWMGV